MTGTMPSWEFAARVREAAVDADRAVWTAQVRAWRQAPSGNEGLTVACQQTAFALRSAADLLDPPNMTTYTSTTTRLVAVLSNVVILAGVTILALVLSGSTLVFGVAAYVTAVAAAFATYHRRLRRRGPRDLDHAEPSAADIAAGLGTEIAALCDALRLVDSPRHAEVLTALEQAAEWAGRAVRRAGS
ncbi:hypothetical protein GCM10009682_17190 [Luedemannella flava]|uniref:SMODS and SLOG-associating 2TM effector domain-containing protein n=1 Tax=Luedemannella flava TaxID=349316 RepID=A0ABN2LPM3_9ACTN